MDLEKEAREIEFHKKLDIIINKTVIAINKSEETLQKTNESKIIIEEINTTTYQTNTTLTKEGEEKECKEKIGLITIILGLILAALSIYVGSINKRNKKLRRLFWTCNYKAPS